MDIFTSITRITNLPSSLPKMSVYSLHESYTALVKIRNNADESIFYITVRLENSVDHIKVNDIILVDECKSTVLEIDTKYSLKSVLSILDSYCGLADATVHGYYTLFPLRNMWRYIIWRDTSNKKSFIKDLSIFHIKNILNHLKKFQELEPLDVKRDFLIGAFELELSFRREQTLRKHKQNK